MTRGRMSVAEYKQIQKVSLNPCKRADAESVYKALVSSSRGREFEEEILKVCEHYKHTKKAVINKVSEPYRVLFKYEHGKFLGQHAGAAEPDFKGVLKGGRAVPWALWRDMKEIFGKKYLMPADIIQYEVPYKRGVMFLDYKNLPFEALCDTVVR